MVEPFVVFQWIFLEELVFLVLVIAHFNNAENY